LDSRIDVKVVSERLETVLSADGIHEAQLNAGDVITIRRSQNRSGSSTWQGHPSSKLCGGSYIGVVQRFEQ
jgi:NAD kinase